MSGRLETAVLVTMVFLVLISTIRCERPPTRDRDHERRLDRIERTLPTIEELARRLDKLDKTRCKCRDRPRELDDDDHDFGWIGDGDDGAKAEKKDAPAPGAIQNPKSKIQN